MDYPLGSFPRFGHQERWARERRQRAIENSITTRRWNAYWRRQREAMGTSLLRECERAVDADDARATLIRLGNVALDWVRFVSRMNHKIKAEATIAAQLSAEAEAIHREVEVMASAFALLPADVDSRAWVAAIRRIEAQYGDLGPRIEDLKHRIAAARIGPIHLLWMRLRAWFEQDSGPPDTRSEN